MVNSRGGTYTPSPAQQTIVTGISHSPHGSHHSTFSAGASPSTNSPTGANSLTKIVVAQVYLLLSTIKEDKDRTKWEQQAEQLRKLIDEHGMEVFQKYFSRLVVGNAGQIFPSLNRPVANPANYQILVNEVRKVSHDTSQARKITEAIETANEDVFRDFDLSTFMDHFKLDALEKTILALAFKMGSRPDLKTKSDAILTASYRQFLDIISNPVPEHEDLSPIFLATILDQLIQESPPSLDGVAKRELAYAIQVRYSHGEQEKPPPTVLLTALYLMYLLSDRYPLVLYIQRTGPPFTADEESCKGFLRNAGDIRLDEEQVSAALVYTTISRHTKYSAAILARSLRSVVPPSFQWQQIIGYFDQPGCRISSLQFLTLYEALRPLAIDGILDIQQMWVGNWQNSETQLSFISALASLTPEQLDATTIPGLRPSFTVEDLEGYSDVAVQEYASRAVKHPLVSVDALSAIFHVALDSTAASDTVEAKRLFQEVVLPNLALFLVSAFGVPKPWPELALDTINNLFGRFVYKYELNFDFVLESLWRKDKNWVAQHLIDTHANKPLDLPIIFEHAVRHKWLDDLTSMLNGFGLDLAALAHARGELDIEAWAQRNASRDELSQSLLTFLNIKAHHELEFQRQQRLHSLMLPVKTVHALLRVLQDSLPNAPSPELVVVQRACITAYPRLINYGEGYDDIIDANGAEKNSLPKEANDTMEVHYKRMYSEELEVRDVVTALEAYKRSRLPSDQDVFACMIHSLFDEYAVYHTYPLEALATTAVLFGGVISQKLISSLPLEISLGMILEAVRDYPPEASMYKFGLQALMQLFNRLPEWPGFCKFLLDVSHLRGTQAWSIAEEIYNKNQVGANQTPQNGVRPHLNGGGITNGDVDEMVQAEPSAPPFRSLHVDPPAEDMEEPDGDTKDKIHFVLNNITTENFESKFNELKSQVHERNESWFAHHLVEERAKMQPNYHELYLNLVKLFGRKSLWVEMLRETYVSSFRILNAETTMQSAIERSHLKNLAVWLGYLTLARDKPIKHRNIAFKQLLAEAYDTKRLIVVVPFVCKVLAQGKSSTVFRPPNPWVMDIIRNLLELYHAQDVIKLNQKFEIEVLCGELDLDHKNIEPSNEILNRAPLAEEATDVMDAEGMDRYDNLSLNGMGGGVGNGRFSPQSIAQLIPDLGPLLVYPPVNDIVDQSKLQEIVRTAITRAVQEIIAPVVERSVTIAAISTAQMIHKDFATEPNEEKLRAAAINMVKKTAGSLALVTSKEPLRASMTNYIRSIAITELGHSLPEGTIIMCVTSNLDLACAQVEKGAEIKAVPEIEDMIQPEIEARRYHKANTPNDPYVDPGLSRWSWTIPPPYKLQPSMGGLNSEQMSIYDEFQRQPQRVAASISGTTHVASSSDATRSMANEILQEQYPSVQSLPAPAESLALPHINTQPPAYTQTNVNAAMANGRIGAVPLDPRAIMDRVQKTLIELGRVVNDTSEQSYASLPRPHQIFDVLDALYSLIIKTAQSPDAIDVYIVDHICALLFSGTERDLMVECLVQVLVNASRIGGRTSSRVGFQIASQPSETLLRVPLVVSLIKAEMLDWPRVDMECSKAIMQRREDSLEFLSSLLDEVLLCDRPIALYADFARSLEVAWQWASEEAAPGIGQQLKQKLTSSGLPQSLDRNPDDRLVIRQRQMEYVFDEWVHLCNNPNASEVSPSKFVSQMYNRQIINNRDDLCLFLRLSIDMSVDRFELLLQSNGTITDAYVSTDSLAKLIAMLVGGREEEGEVRADKAAYLKSILSLVVLVLNHHHVMRGEHFNQKVFFRLFSSILCELDSLGTDFTEEERQHILLVFASMLTDIRPSYFPGFMFGWLELIAHRSFLPPLMALPDNLGWKSLAEIMEILMDFVSELLKPLQITPVTKDIYRGVLKLIVVVQHDFPEFLAANSARLSANIPNHCTQLHNLILNANPAPFSKSSDPLHPGLKVDRVEEIRDNPEGLTDPDTPLRQNGLIEILDLALRTGPSEDAVAQIAHAIQQKTRQSGVGFVPLNVDLKLIDSIVGYVGTQSITRNAQKNGPVFISGSPDAALLCMLVHELQAEARYFFLGSIVDQLRYPNSHTHYFTQALIEIFGNDLDDQEENDIRQQITRILLERMIAQWPQPWGLVIVIHEIIKNEKCLFFELPFIKAAPEVADRFLAFANRPVV
jgi:CCR4-NOT transcription complex subunit 1